MAKNDSEYFNDNNNNKNENPMILLFMNKSECENNNACAIFYLCLSRLLQQHVLNICSSGHKCATIKINYSQNAFGSFVDAQSYYKNTLKQKVCHKIDPKSGYNQFIKDRKEIVRVEANKKHSSSYGAR